LPEAAVGGFGGLFEARKRYGLSEVTKEKLGFKVKGRIVVGKGES